MSTQQHHRSSDGGSIAFKSSSAVNPAKYVSLNCNSAFEVYVLLGYGTSSVNWCQMFRDTIVVSSSVEATIEDKTICLEYQASTTQWCGANPEEWRLKVHAAKANKLAFCCGTVFTKQVYIWKYYCFYVSLQWGIQVLQDMCCVVGWRLGPTTRTTLMWESQTPH